MTEYITKLQALQAFEKAERLNTGFGRLNLFGLLSLELASIQTADVSPIVRGEWVWQEDTLVCSICERPAPTEGEYVQVETPYCPQCGARMEVEE
jgi:hypothetical protein